MAIKHNELRIGNFVQDEHGIVQYVYRLWQGGAELAEDENGGEDLDHTNEEMFGVPITDDWLENLGFKFNNEADGWFTSEDSEFFIEPWDNNFAIRWDGSIVGQYISSVHQLQNIYFALTGLELELKSALAKKEKKKR